MTTLFAAAPPRRRAAARGDVPNVPLDVFAG